MQVRVFSLCFSSELRGFDDRELVAFCASHRITEVAHHVVQVDGEPWLLVLLSWRGESLATSSEVIRRSSSEDVAVAAQSLDPQELARYEALRQWRNQHARTTGKPPYLLFNNRQALAIARAAPTTLSALSNVEGIGASKLEAVGAQILELLNGPGSVVAADTPTVTIERHE